MTRELPSIPSRQRDTRPVCPECQASGKSATIREVGRGITIVPETDEYWDNEGRKHIHRLQIASVTFACEHGHRFQEIDPVDPCFCGWTHPTHGTVAKRTESLAANTFMSDMMSPNRQVNDAPNRDHLTPSARDRAGI